MFRNNKILRDDPVEIGDLILTRSDKFYFLEFAEYTKNIFDSLRVKSKPSMIFYTESSENYVILDYSVASNEDKMFVNAFFTKMNVGDAFTVSKGNYVDDTNEVEADVSGSFTFNKFADNMVFAKVVSTTDKDANVNVYSATYFISTPQLSKATSLQSSSDTKIQALVSSNPKTTAKPIVYLGVQPGDLLEILWPDSVNNNKKYRVVDAAVINDKEVIYLDSSDIVYESLLGKPVIVNLYQYSKKEVSSLTDLSSDTTLGCCINSELNVALPFHTANQCTYRGSGFAFKTGLCSDTTINLNAAITNTTTVATSSITENAQEISYNNLQALQYSLPVGTLDNLTAFLKKKTITSESDFNIREGFFTSTVENDNLVPIEKYFMTNNYKYTVPAIVNGYAQTNLTQAIIPGSILETVPGITLELVNIRTESNLYRLLNISYEAVITDTDVVLRTFEGNRTNNYKLSLNKNILTTVYESSLVDDYGEVLQFSVSKQNPKAVTDFGALGYGYVKIGRYHIFTPVSDTITPLYLITNRGKVSSYSIEGITIPTVLPNYAII
jgi:hypothetical protein